MPRTTYFKPAGVPLRALQDVGMTVEEAEAIRLRDREGLSHEKCADRMRISRPTFHRVLRSARRKVADVLISGKALRIEGGSFALDRQPFRCPRDGHEWLVRFEDVVAGQRPACPLCQGRVHQQSTTGEAAPLPARAEGQARKTAGSANKNRREMRPGCR